MKPMKPTLPKSRNSGGSGLNWKRATPAACMASILVVVVLNPGLEFASRNNIYSLPNGMSIGCFSLLTFIVVFIIVSWLTSREPERRLPPDVDALMGI